MSSTVSTSSDRHSSLSSTFFLSTSDLLGLADGTDACTKSSNLLLLEVEDDEWYIFEEEDATDATEDGLRKVEVTCKDDPEGLIIDDA